MIESIVCIMFGLSPINLGSDNFRVRESQTRSIESALPYSLPVVVGGLESKDPEIAYRCDRILGRWKSRNPIGYLIFNRDLRELLSSNEPSEKLKVRFQNWRNFDDLVAFSKKSGLANENESFSDGCPEAQAGWIANRALIVRRGEKRH